MSASLCSCGFLHDPKKLFLDRALDPRGPASPHGDFFHMLGGDSETLANSAVNSAVPSRVLQFRADTDKINGGLQRHCESENSSRFHSKSRDFYVPRKITGSVAERIRALRKSLGLNQTAFARKLGTRPSTVSKWESGHNRPLPDVFVKMAKLTEGTEKLYFLDLAGVPDAFFEGAPMTGEMLNAATRIVARALPESNEQDTTFVRLAEPIPVTTVPLIKHPKFVGTRDAVDNVEAVLPIPPVWIPAHGNIQAARFSNPGSSLFEGDLIGLIDINRRDADRLVGCTVAVRTEAGLEAARLRKDGANYLLMPFSATGVPRLLRDGDRSIVGRIVKWIPDAPSDITEDEMAPKSGKPHKLPRKRSSAA